jgi:hypothetical protein
MEYFTAFKARKVAESNQARKIMEDSETKEVLEYIKKAAEGGRFEIETYYSFKLKENLTLLGYRCSEPFEKSIDETMTVSWGQ